MTCPQLLGHIVNSIRSSHLSKTKSLESHKCICITTTGVQEVLGYILVVKKIKNHQGHWISKYPVNMSRHQSTAWWGVDNEKPAFRRVSSLKMANIRLFVGIE